MLAISLNVIADKFKYKAFVNLMELLMWFCEKKLGHFYHAKVKCINVEVKDFTVLHNLGV